MNTRVLVAVICAAVLTACSSDSGSNPTPATCTVSAVNVSPATATVPIGLTTALTALVGQQNCDATAPTWSSSNQTVATVAANGLVTALASGTSTITATLKGVQGSALVTVPQCISAITFDQTTLTIAVPLTTHINAMVAPSTCPVETVTWTSSSNAIATVGNGNVTAVSPGTATITATIGTVSATAAVTIVSPQLGSVWDQTTLRVAGGASAPAEFISSAWAASANDVFVTANPYYYRYNGTTWSKLAGDSYGVEAMWGLSSLDVFGVGQTIRHFNGTAWTEMTSPTSQRLRGVWGSSSTNVFAVGQGGTIARYNGTAWALMSSPTTANLVGISGASANLIFAVAEDGSIIRFDGTAWAVVVPPSGQFLTGIWLASSTLGYATGASGVLKFNGTSWSSDASYANINGTLRAVWGSSAANVVVVGDVGFMSRFDGTDWNTVTRRTGERLSMVTGSGNTAFAFGINTTVQQTGGTSQLLTSAPELTSVWAVDANTYFAVGHDGVVWKYANAVWQLQTTNTFTHFDDVWAASATQVLAIGTDPVTNQAVVYQYNGSSWQRTTLVGVGGLKSLWGSSFTNVIAGSRFGPLQRFDGTSWTDAANAPSSDFGVLWGTSATDILLVGSSGYAARYTGTSVLTPITTGTASALVSVWGSSATDYFAGTNNGGMFHFNGTAFSPMTMPNQTGGLYALWGLSATQVYAVDYNGSTYRYDGTQWVRLREGVANSYFTALHGVATRLVAVGPNGVVMTTR